MIHGDKDAGVPIWHSEKFLAAYKKNNVPQRTDGDQGRGARV